MKDPEQVQQEGQETSKIDEIKIKKKKTKKLVDDDYGNEVNPDDDGPKTSFLDRFSHLKCSR